MNHQKSVLAPGLYFVGTPIGTARDITLRALDVLASADMLVAEDTRSLRRLMDIHGIDLGERRLLAYHDHSGAAARRKIIAALGAGLAVAYASEAGMPLIADPGYDLAREVRDAGFAVTAAPGPSAVLTALALGGLPTDAFFFAGFLPGAVQARRNRLRDLRAVPGTLIFFESPRRLADSLADMAAELGDDRQAAICRELTKRFEEIRHATLGELAAQTRGQTIRGEVVILVDRMRSQAVSTSQIEQELERALRDNSVRDAADLVSRAFGLQRREVYQMALKLGKN